MIEKTADTAFLLQQRDEEKGTSQDSRQDKSTANDDRPHLDETHDEILARKMKLHFRTISKPDSHYSPIFVTNNPNLLLIPCQDLSPSIPDHDAPLGEAVS